MSSVDPLFAQLIAESEAFTAAKKASKAAIGSRNSRVLPAPQPKVDKLKLLHDKRVADFAALGQGILPGGWELEGLVMQVCEYTCTCCGSITRAMNPPEVFQVMRQTRHHETKYMRPLRDGELQYYLHAVRAEVHIERTAKYVPLCQTCEGNPLSELGRLM